jgi:hypothetical protein
MTERFAAHWPDTRTIAAPELFDTRGRSVHRYYFYDDEDGRKSFASFSEYYQVRGWRCETKDDYVVFSKSANGRTIELFANQPGSVEKGEEELAALFAKTGRKPVVLIHRGHSYHAPLTLAKLQPDMKLVMLGSCGGYREINTVLSVSPDAQILATQGTGTATVNEPILGAISEALLASPQAAIQWRTIWSRLERQLGSNPDFKKYVAPDRNSAVMFVRALHELERNGTK